MSKVFPAVSAVMAEIGSISKDRKNQGQGYVFRGIDDIYNSIHPLLLKHKLFTVPQVLEQTREVHVTPKGTSLFYSVLKIKYTLYAEDGSSIEATVVGEGMDSGDKASNKAMAAAHKYFFLQLFAIPTEDAKDSERDDHETMAKQPARPAPQSQRLTVAKPAKSDDLGSFVMTIGKNKGKRLDEIDMYQLNGWLEYMRKADDIGPSAMQAITAVEAFLDSRERPAAAVK